VFETAELGRKVTRREFKEQAPQLRIQLLEVQRQLRQEASFPVFIVFGGVNGAGKSETANVLTEWMDPRGINTRAFNRLSETEKHLPEYWRYWLALPPKGKFGIFLSAWYSKPLLDRAYGHAELAAFDQRLNRINAFEKELAADGALILKFWMYLGKEAQRKRLQILEKDPLTRWRVTDQEKKHWKMYESFKLASDRLLHKTSTSEATWHIIEGADPNYRTLAVAKHIRDAVQQRLGLGKKKASVKSARAKDNAKAPVFEPRIPNVLTRLDLDQRLAKKDYSVQLEQYQGRLNQLARQAKASDVSTILVFEGTDAAGKGGAIRRLTAAMDVRDYQVIPIAAPTDEEKAHHYMWRFWRHLPAAGRVTIFDRSWYGRVLVERVEGFASVDEWQRAYTEINDFEEQLVDHGVVLVKFWIHIAKDEQLRRFKDREETPYKRWKMTDEDWRNRKRWDEYEAAVDDMVTYTSTAFAPWTLVEGNDKRFARVKVLETLCKALKARLAGRDNKGKKV